jgi:RNA polymerase sigma factor (sigma-70 family)
MAEPDDTSESNVEITAAVLRERSRIGNFIRQRVRDREDSEDILQDVFHEFVEASRLPAPIEQASAWLFHVARRRIIDRFRKHREVSLADASPSDGSEDDELRLELALPTTTDGPEAAYTRSAILKALQTALDELPSNQREVFIAHEIEGRSFKDMSASTGVPVNTLLARKRYALLFLRARLQPIHDDLQF